jgi:hypothetical protein
MKKPFLIVLIAACMQLPLYAQINSNTQVAPKSTTDIKDVVARLQTLSSDRVIEKAYLHFDKSYYNPGDTIYFKAYVTAGERHELSKISGVLHVDLISKSDSVIMQSLILQLTNGQALGDFALPAYVPKGNYRVRAYTQWMQNSGSKYFFDKNIPVTGKSISKVADVVKTTDKKIDVQFFPEGGSFVNAVPSRMAFKAIGSDGLGVNIKGIIVDNLNKAVAKFASTHLGMGQFFITAEDGKSYKAKINYPDGSVNTIDLPKADTKGMALTVNNEKPGKLSIDINANKPYYLENKNKEITIVIYASGIVKTVKTVLDNQVIGLDLPTNDFKTGVVQVTVFSQAGMPLNERLAFIQNTDVLNLAVNAKPTYAANEKAGITLNVKGSDDKPSAGYFSVAVTDDNQLQVDDNAERSILSDLLLSTEVKGYIEQPNYYFSAANADAKANLDILMLTQGYRRFVWNELLNEPAPAITYNPENDLQVSGVMTTKDGKPVANEKLSLFLASSGQSLITTTNAGGKFVFGGLGFPDKTKFILKTENPALKSKVKITLYKTYSGLPVTASTQPVSKPIDNLPENTKPEVINNVKIRQLKQGDVKVKDKNVYRTVSYAGSGNADQVINYNDFKNAVKLSDGLTGLARGVTFARGVPYLKNSLSFSDSKSGLVPMLIVVDGIIGVDNIDSYNPSDIERIEILKSANASIYGLGAGGGVMILTTKMGGDGMESATSVEMAPGLLSIAPQGFYKARNFYTPRYDVAAASNNFTGTVLWNPNLNTDKDGNATFNIVNASKSGTYRIVIEGIDSNGNLGRSVYKYKVQ